jgi:hypothetical protein
MGSARDFRLINLASKLQLQFLILSVVLHGCKLGHSTAGRTQRVLEKRVLKKRKLQEAE